MIRELLFEQDPYEGFQPRECELRGWNSEHPKLAELIRETQPKLIVEIGSWLGASAIYMASHTDAEILCIDTWTGAPEMWTDKTDPERYQALKIEQGMPTIYRDFLSNVVRAGKQHQITPFPVPSTVGLTALRKLGIKPDLIYIDGDHTYRNVQTDISMSCELFPQIICGDDFIYWPDVARAVTKELPDRYVELDGFWWVKMRDRKTSGAIE